MHKNSTEIFGLVFSYTKFQFFHVGKSTNKSGYFGMKGYFEGVWSRPRVRESNLSWSLIHFESENAWINLDLEWFLKKCNSYQSSPLQKNFNISHV